MAKVTIILEDGIGTDVSGSITMDPPMESIATATSAQLSAIYMMERLQDRAQGFQMAETKEELENQNNGNITH